MNKEEYYYGTRTHREKQGCRYFFPAAGQFQQDDTRQNSGPEPGRVVLHMTKSKALEATEVPLYLLPKTIARQLSLFGDAVYRISVKRTHWHHYNVTVRTKSIRREIRPAPVAVVEAAPVNSRGVRRRCEA